MSASCYRLANERTDIGRRQFSNVPDWSGFSRQTALEMLATNQGCFKFAFSAGRSQLQLLPERVGRCLSDRCINL